MNQAALRSYITELLPLSEEDLALLMSCVEYLELKKGEPLLKVGEVCRCFYLVEKGYLRSWYNKDGVTINLNFTFEGQYATNLKSIKHKQPSLFTIEAGEDTSLWVFRFSQLANQVNDHPQISRFARRVTVRLAMAFEENSELFKIYTPTERYQYIEQNNPQLLQRVSLSQMASYLGVTRETLSRIRGKNH